MIVNIFGSTGIIGKKALKIIKNSYKNYKVNVLCAKENYKLLAKQCNEFNAKYAYLDNQNKNSQLRSLLSKDVKILNKQNLKENLIKRLYLNEKKISDFRNKKLSPSEEKIFFNNSLFTLKLKLSSAVEYFSLLI